MSEDCYIYWDDDTVSDDDRCIYILCTKCHNDGKKPSPTAPKGDLWRAENGYGPTVLCYICKHTIHKGDDANTERK